VLQVVPCDSDLTRGGDLPHHTQGEGVGLLTRVASEAIHPGQRDRHRIARGSAAKARGARELGLLAPGASERVCTRSPDGPCELLGLGREDALGEVEGVTLDLAAAAGDQRMQESRFALVGKALGAFIGLLAENGEVVVVAD
jgi:hypothetical protein